MHSYHQILNIKENLFIDDILSIDDIKEQLDIVNIKIKAEKHILSFEKRYLSIFKLSLDNNHITNANYEMLIDKLALDMKQSNIQLHYLYTTAIKLYLIMFNQSKNDIL